MKTHIELTHHPIIPPPLPAGDREIGAQLDFLGMVREMEAGRPIPGLNYEAHEPMALSMMESILTDLALRHPCHEVWIVHRLDFVPVGETALFVRVHSQHRQAALHMMDELIDRIKKDVPIWKRLESVTNNTDCADLFDPARERCAFAIQSSRVNKEQPTRAVALPRG
jgi:molybdopterin synthase catalytic subunit